jgi:NAD(P) transhydrogenase subunit alpha
MYSKNIATLVAEFVSDEGELALDFENDVVGPATVTHAGEIRNERIRQALGGTR